MKYNLNSKEERPNFKFVVYCPSRYTSYWLFSTMHEAVEMAFYLSLKMKLIYCVAEPYLCKSTHQWHLMNFATLRSGELYLEEDREQLLHLKWYMDAGEWENPRAL